MTLSIRRLEDPTDYDGSQLSSLFAYRTAGIAGDSVVAFRGACRVTNDTMVDLEDLLGGQRIESPDMVHFVAEHFGERLEAMVLRQRLFARLAAELVAERSGRPVTVRGDDVYVAERKASISVATVSPVSGLFHFGINVRTEGVPVPAIGLEELGVGWDDFADAALVRYRDEMADVRAAASKVRWVR